MNKYIISIEGNIGSGKSTLLKILKEQYTSLNGYNIIYLTEPVDSWNEIKDENNKTIIENFYENQHKYAFSFQMMAYITRLTQLKKILNDAPDSSIIITERCLYTDRYVFAKMLFDNKTMEHIEYTIYLKWFDEFIEYTKLSGIVYIKTDPEVCVKRIAKRSRSGEDLIPLSYLESCDNYHNNWILNDSDVITQLIDGNNEIIDIAQIKRFILKVINKEHQTILQKSIDYLTTDVFNSECLLCKIQNRIKNKMIDENTFTMDVKVNIDDVIVNEFKDIIIEKQKEEEKIQEELKLSQITEEKIQEFKEITN